MKHFLKSVTAALAAACTMIAGPAAAMSEDDPVLTMVKLDQFEVRDAEGSPLVVEGFAWIGRDLDKLWLEVDAERVHGDTEEAELQLLYGRAIAPYWDFQVGWRHDFRPQPERDWLAVGVQGLAPYFFDVDATAFLGQDGQFALRLVAEYEMMLTQRWVLSPEVEINAYSKDDPAVGIGSGLADLQLSLRLAYEVRREVAPYVGFSYIRKFGTTADLAAEDGEPTDDFQLLAGIRLWF